MVSEVLMRRPFLIGCLILVACASAATQPAVTGRWRAVLLIPDGGTQNISLELDLRVRPSPGRSRVSTFVKVVSMAAR
jgi:hypothetical protein